MTHLVIHQSWSQTYTLFAMEDASRQISWLSLHSFITWRSFRDWNFNICLIAQCFTLIHMAYLKGGKKNLMVHLFWILSNNELMHKIVSNLNVFLTANRITLLHMGSSPTIYTGYYHAINARNTVSIHSMQIHYRQFFFFWQKIGGGKKCKEDPKMFKKGFWLLITRILITHSTSG